MRRISNTYYSLMTSLPRYAISYKTSERHLSRIQLEKRFRLLEENTKRYLDEVEWLLWQSWFMPGLTLNELQSRSARILSESPELIKELLFSFLNLRTVLTAFSVRQAEPESKAGSIALLRGTMREQILKNWQKEDFGLGNLYPKMKAILQFAQVNQASLAEESILNLLWQLLDKFENGHYFDLMAVIIYLLRWNIVDYWSSFDVNQALAKINEMIKTLLKEVKDE